MRGEEVEHLGIPGESLAQLLVERRLAMGLQAPEAPVLLGDRSSLLDAANQITAMGFRTP
jgi:hypothetical protein